MGLDGKTWEPDARRQDPVLYSVCDTVDLCDKHGGAESRPKYEAVKQSPSRVRTGSCTLQQLCWKTLFRRWSNAQPHDSARLLLFLVVPRSLISSSC